LEQISTKDYDIVKFAHTFYFNDQCQTVSGQQLIFLQFSLPLSIIKSKSDRKRICKFDGCGFVKKWQNLTDSKADSKSITPFFCFLALTNYKLQKEYKLFLCC